MALLLPVDGWRLPCFLGSSGWFWGLESQRIEDRLVYVMYQLDQMHIGFSLRFLDKFRCCRMPAVLI